MKRFVIGFALVVLSSSAAFAEPSKEGSCKTTKVFGQTFSWSWTPGQAKPVKSYEECVVEAINASKDSDVRYVDFTFKDGNLKISGSVKLKH